MIPRFNPNITLKELSTIFLKAEQEDILEYEKAFARKAGQKYAIAFPYGRTALYVLLKALDLVGKDIICPAYTCVVVPHSIVKSGNYPVFIDAQKTDFNMNLDLIPEALSQNTGAIIATSLFGYPVNTEQLKTLKARYPQVAIIQDCAHSFFARWQDEPVHTVGKAAFYGLNISKIIHAIFGGMLTTDDPVLAAKLRQISQDLMTEASWQKSLKRRLYFLASSIAFSHHFYRYTNMFERSQLLNKFTKYYDEDRIYLPADFLMNMHPIEAKIGFKCLGKYDEIIASRIQIATYYQSALQHIPSFILPPIQEGATYSHYVMRVADRDKVLKAALKQGIQLGQLIEYNIPEMRAYQKMPGSRFTYPVASNYAKTTINLPLCSGMKAAVKVVDFLKKFSEQR